MIWKQWWTPPLASVLCQPDFCETWESPRLVRVVFYLADDRPVEWDVGEARTTVDGISGVTPVIFGEDDAEPLLGAVTLQITAAWVDPSAERLVPRRSRF